MNTVEILLLVNSGLLGLIGLLFGVVGFFVRDLHKDFKKLAGEVNGIARDQSVHLEGFGILRELFRKELKKVVNRLDRLEKKGGKK